MFRIGTLVGDVMGLRTLVSGVLLFVLYIPANATQPQPQLTAQINVSSSSGIAPDLIFFSAGGSQPARDIRRYSWNFGDGATASGFFADHLFSKSGTFTVRLTIYDGPAQASATKTVTIKPNLPPVAAFSATQISAAQGNLKVKFDASASQDPNGQGLFYQWNFGDTGARDNDGNWDENSFFQMALNFLSQLFRRFNLSNGPIVTHQYAKAGTYNVKLTVINYKGSRNSITKQVQVIVAQPPTVHFTSVTPVTGVAPYSALFNTAGTVDSNGLPLTYAWNFGDGNTSSASGLVTHTFTDPSTYTVTLTVSNSMNLSASAHLDISVTAPPPPPAPPEQQAPPLATGGNPTVSQSVAFLYSGSNPIQTGVQPGAIVDTRVAVVHGRVLDDQGNPLPGVTISVVGSPQLGQTISRADGKFDLAVNGGGTVSVNYQLTGYLTSQRSIKTSMQDYFAAPDVMLIKPDPKVTPITLGATTTQIVQGTPQTDSRGTRTTTLLVPAQVTAQFVLPSGQMMPVSNLSMRATEFTVGDQGPNRMPGTLPVTSAYTYAVDISSDEGRALGAKHILFSQKIPFYVDNFLNIQTGMIVPVGMYNADTGMWDPQPDGLVINILSVQNGQAVIDVTGTGPASASDLAALGVTAEELKQLAVTYGAGHSLWRIYNDHFSLFDGNFMGSIATNAAQPNGAKATSPNEGPKCTPPGGTQKGSIISVANQALGESIPLVGTPLTLNYSTTRSPGRIAERTLWIPLTTATPPPGLEGIVFGVDIAGKSFTQTFSTGPGLVGVYTWDGNDAFGRAIDAAQTARITISYSYMPNYLNKLGVPLGLSGSFSFGQITGDITVNSGINGLPDFLTQTTQVKVGTKSARNEVGGWLISAHHSYDPLNDILYYGDGTSDTVQGYRTYIVPVTTASGFFPMDVLVASDGSTYITILSQVIKVAPNGTSSVFAGTTSNGYGGDNGPATSAILNTPVGLAEGPDGSIYIADSGNSRIRKVDKSGIISTFAGSSTAGFGGDGGLATSAKLNRPLFLKFLEGTLYFTDFNNNAIRSVNPLGIINTIAGKPVNPGYSGDGGPALSAFLNLPIGLTISPQGDIYFVDSGNYRIRKISKSGMISTIAGNGTTSFTDVGNGGPALDAALVQPYGITIGNDGTVYFSELSPGGIRSISPDGTINLFAGDQEVDSVTTGTLASGAAATQTRLAGPRGLFAQGSQVWMAENSDVRIITPSLSGISNGGNFAIPSKNGSEIYIFDPSGQHLQTLNAITGAPKWTFGYDSSGRVITVTDGDQNVTTITRDSNGTPTSIIAPFGQVTTLTTDADGNLASVTNPNAETYRMQYLAGSMLSQFTRPSGNSSTMSYDSYGLLTKDQDAAGGFTALMRTLTSTNIHVDVSTAAGRMSSMDHQGSILSKEGAAYTDGAGLVSSTTSTANTSVATSNPGNVSTNATLQADPRLGLPAQLQAANITTMSGTQSISYQSTTSRTITSSTSSNPFEYESLDTLTTNGKVSTVQYSGATRTYLSTSAMGRTATQTIDSQGRVLQSQVASFTPSVFQYDARGHLTGIAQGGRSTSLKYDAQGNLASRTDALNQTTSYSYDGAGRVIGTKLPDGRIIAQTYDADGNLASVTPPGRQAYGLVNNLIDLLTTFQMPSIGSGTGAIQYTYNLDKQLSTITRPDGVQITNNYDTVTDRLLSVSSSLGNIAYTYDSQGRRATATSPDNIATAYGYTGNLVTSLQNSGAVSSLFTETYNNDLLPTSTSAGGIAINFAYDKDNLLVQAGSMTLTRDPASGLVSGTVLGNITDSTTYNSFGELQSYTALNGSTVLYSFTLDRDVLGRITTKTETIGGVTTGYGYVYDSAGRLTGTTKNGLPFSSYSYDSNSNRTSATINGQASSGTYDAQDRAISYGQATYGFNDNGEMISKTGPLGTVAYGYSLSGKLSSAHFPNGNTQKYLFDGNDRFSGTQVNGALTRVYVHGVDGRFEAELDASGNLLQRYGHATSDLGPDFMIANGITYRYLKDHLGSVRLVVNVNDGTILERLDYDEFGVVTMDTNPSIQPFAFTGGIYNVNTLRVGLGERAYDAQSGRWTQRDPILFDVGDTNLYGYVGTVGKPSIIETNLYQYTMSDPVNFIDPSGLSGVPAIGPPEGGSKTGCEGASCRQSGANIQHAGMCITVVCFLAPLPPAQKTICSMAGTYVTNVGRGIKIGCEPPPPNCSASGE